MNPRSVALIGASDDGDRLSGRPLRYTREAGFAGKLYPVNPSRPVVQGLKSYASVRDLPEIPDVALVTVPANLVLPALRECAAKGVGAVILYAAGFAEVGEAGKAEQREIVDICRTTGMRLLGPNCLGVFNSKIGLFATFATSLDRGFPRPGNVAVVSQSGAYGQHLCYLADQRGLGVSYMITTGNEANVGLGEALAWVVEQPGVDVVMAYAEGVGDGRALTAALARAQAAGKRVVFLKVGASEAGSRAASSHTAALAGNDAVYEGVFRQFGVARARSLEEQIDIAYACRLGKLPAGRGLGVATFSGGLGIHICDVAGERGLAVPPMPLAAQSELKKIMPFGSPINPVDWTGMAASDVSLVTAALRAILEQDCYDAVLIYLGTVPLAPAIGEKVQKAIAEAASGSPGKLVVVSMSADPEIVRLYEASGVLVFEDPSRAVTALAALADMRERAAPIPVAAAPAPGPPLPAHALSEFEASAILAAVGVPALPQRLARTREECAQAAAAIGFPIVLKVVSAQILHKTEIGGVALDIRDPAAAERAYDDLCARAARVPGAVLDGILVTPMAPRGLETIMGVVKDPTFGPMVMFGLGGVFVEVFRDVTFRLAPFGVEEARRMIAGLRNREILRGVRGAKPYDVDAVAAALAALSQFALRDEIESVDINPFVVWEAGKGAAALDALIVRASLP